MTEQLTVIALLDANILYSAALRDIFLQLAVNKLYWPRWSPDIGQEWRQTLYARRPDLSPARWERTWSKMALYFPYALVENYSHLIDDLHLPDPDDRHVLAAAIVGGCTSIVTSNLKDFPADSVSKFGIAVHHPDEFLLRLLDESTNDFCSAVRNILARLKHPPYSVAEYLSNLSQIGLRQTAAKLELHTPLLA